VFSLYTASVLRGALRFFYKIDLLSIKKKIVGKFGGRIETIVVRFHCLSVSKNKKDPLVLVVGWKVGERLAYYVGRP
jgi:hypothetical protein